MCYTKAVNEVSLQRQRNYKRSPYWTPQDTIWWLQTLLLLLRWFFFFFALLSHKPACCCQQNIFVSDVRMIWPRQHQSESSLKFVTAPAHLTAMSFSINSKTGCQNSKNKRGPSFVLLKELHLSFILTGVNCIHRFNAISVSQSAIPGIRSMFLKYFVYSPSQTVPIGTCNVLE